MNNRNTHTQNRFKPLCAALFAVTLLAGCSADEGPAGVDSTTILTIGQFAARPNTVAPGGSTTLSYTSSGAASCAASSNAPGSSWMGPQPTSGSFVVTVPQTPGNYTYTLTCSSATGQQTSQTETVTVTAPAGMPPVITNLTATPASVAPGGSTQLSYTTSGATSCVANSSAPGSSWMGSQPTSSTGTVVIVPTTPGNYTYALTCTNASGQQTTDFETVTVTGTGGGGGAGGGNTPGVIGGEPGGLLPNTGTTPTNVTDGPGGPVIPGNFLCTSSARAFGDSPTATVTVNGLVGPPLTGLLNMLGAGTVTQLLNSVTAPESAVDRNLSTFAQFNLTAGLLTTLLNSNLVSSVDLNIGLNSPVPSGRFAVFGVTFPTATVEATLMQTLRVTTFLGNTLAERRSISLTALDLLGVGVQGERALFVGFRTTQPYDRTTISLDPSVVSVNAGNAMRVHELCTDGSLIPSAP